MLFGIDRTYWDDSRNGYSGIGFSNSDFTMVCADFCYCNLYRDLYLSSSAFVDRS